jgi:hypothetical protein
MAGSQSAPPPSAIPIAHLHPVANKIHDVSPNNGVLFEEKGRKGGSFFLEVPSRILACARASSILFWF